jgi:predicted Zn-dependent peptidase
LVSASAADVIFDLEADRISSLSIDLAIVESERGVSMNVTWSGKFSGDCCHNHAGNCFQEHPYHWPVMGYEDDMKNWNQQDGALF